jgi:hypothetical protein
LRGRGAIAGLVALVVTTTLLSSGCASKRLQPRSARGQGPEVGVYRGRIAEVDGKSRKFRLLLYAELPDRLHGEVLHPLGGTELIVDGNSERLAVSVVRERLAFVGRPDAGLMRQVIGVGVTPDELVRVLLTGQAGSAALRFEREGGRGPALPERFEIEADRRVLRLQLKRIDALRASRSDLAEAAPPVGFEVHPLEELRWDWLEEDPAETAPAGSGTAPE